MAELKVSSVMNDMAFKWLKVNASGKSQVENNKVGRLF